MIRNRRDKELLAKQEGGISDDRFPKTSRLWSSLKNPRIVRVSRLFGGKDRHSKVSTIRGLRDRRVRLSVPTAVQLYDLQDRLGLSQPSKVVDWLLDAAQHEIDKLPPLSIPQGNYVQSPQSSIPFKVAQSQTSSRPSAFENSEYFGGNGACSLALSSKQANEETNNNAAAAGDLVGTSPKSTYRDFHALQRNKQKEAMTEARSAKGNTVEGDEVPNQGVGLQCFEDLDNGPLPRIDDSSLLGLLNNSMPCSSYYQWDPSNAYVSHSESHSSEAEGPNMFSSTSISSSMPLMPGSQLVYYPSGAVPSMVEKQFDHFHMTSSASKNLSLNSLRTPQPWRPAVRFFQSNLAPKQHHSQNQSAN